METIKRRAVSEPPTSPKRRRHTFRRLVGFLDLPAELRTQIYELALVSREHIDLLSFASPRTYQRPFQTTKLSPAILQTCKQVYEEASDVLYGLNTFYLNIRTRPSLQRICRFWNVPASVGDELRCLSDRPDFTPLKRRIPKRLRIHLEPVPSQKSFKPIEACNEHLLADVCATFMLQRSAPDLVILTIGSIAKMPGADQRWEEVLKTDRDMNLEALGCVFSLSNPRALVVQSRSRREQKLWYNKLQEQFPALAASLELEIPRCFSSTRQFKHVRR